jgi:2,4-dienoyl-CoA reductase-like NADH-dependent reductase (Old Yellow Enzyme family)
LLTNAVRCCYSSQVDITIRTRTSGLSERMGDMTADSIFQPLTFRSLTVRNRIFRANISGRFDNADGSGNQARINWETKFAKGGVGAIISAFAPIDVRGRIVPNYAAIDRDEFIPFWRELGRQVHHYDCKYIVQLAHGGRQRDIRGIEYPKGLSSTDKPDPVHGFEAERMTVQDIQNVVEAFAQAARRVREAGLDGVEIHGANGYLFTQFLSSAINDREDDYGGILENRARLLLEVVEAIRAEVGRDFHLQVKLSTTDYANVLYPWAKSGNTIEDSLEVCRWLERAGVDAIHVSTGSMFAHPRNPAGSFSVREAAKTYDTILGSGRYAFRNYLLFHVWPLNALFERMWRRGGVSLNRVEGSNLNDAAAVKRAVSIPVLCTGGFQTASVIRSAIDTDKCDAVTIARPLVANNDLVRLFEQGLDHPPVPCTFCNKCLFNVLKNPLGCYEESRFSSEAEMLEQILSVFDPPPYTSRDGEAEDQLPA